MAGKSTSARKTPKVKAHVLIIESRYYAAVADALLEGATAELAASSATYDKVEVPGALEIPQAFAQAVSAGLLNADASGAKYDGAIVLGCVIRGETSHYDIVCNNANHWLMQTAIAYNVPLGNAILTVNTEVQAMARASGGRKGKGADAAHACLSLIELGRAFEEFDE